MLSRVISQNTTPQEYSRTRPQNPLPYLFGGNVRWELEPLDRAGLVLSVLLALNEHLSKRHAGIQPSKGVMRSECWVIRIRSMYTLNRFDTRLVRTQI
jgi:hypothetical protein